MKFSIIIAAYNISDYIGQAISSCINQVGVEKEEYEIIVINDGSTDSTLEIINRYSDQENISIVSQANSGLSATRNRGIELSKGDFILFLDGDDWLSDNALSILERNIEDADAVLFPMVYWYGDNDYELKSYNLEERIFGFQELLHNTIGKQKLNVIPAQCKCYSRKVLCQFNQRFINGILHEDNPFFMDFINNFKKIKYIDVGIYYYRQNRDGSITSRQTLRNFEGTIVGIEHTLQLYGYKNKDINYLMTCWHVFQAMLKYNKEEDFQQVIRYYRSWNVKLSLLRMLVNCSFIPKQMIRTMILIVDPMLLHQIGDIMYGKQRK